MKGTLCYTRRMSGFGEIGLVWAEGGEGARDRLKAVFLPAGRIPVAARIGEAFPGAVERSRRAAGLFGDRIERYLAGDKVGFYTEETDLDACGPFQQRVLRAALQIPRGRVVTYGVLADLAGHPRAARAVGTALARNPFAIVIPCHRIVRADRRPGAFGGGTAMKRALLEMEGVRFEPDGRVERSCLWP